MPLKRPLYAPAILLLAGCAAAPPAPHQVIVIPAGADAAYDQYHYAPALRVGDTVIVSGIPAARGASYEEKVRNMFERLKKTLAAAGADLSDVVEIDTYHATVHDTPAFQKEFAEFLRVHQEYFGDRRPAWTAVGTTALLADGAVLEMRAVAVVGSGHDAEVKRGQ